MKELIKYKTLSLIFFWVFISNLLIFVSVPIFLSDKLKTTDTENTALIIICITIVLMELIFNVYFNKKFENLAQKKYITDPESAREQYFNDLKDLN